MSKKDYQAIAAAFHQVRARDSEFRGRLTEGEMWAAMVEAFAVVAQNKNARFDRALFWEACETGKCKGMRPVAA